MKTEYTSRRRTFVAGITAAAVTTVLVSAVVESLNPALLFKGGEFAGPEASVIASARRDAALIREA